MSAISIFIRHLVLPLSRAKPMSDLWTSAVYRFLSYVTLALAGMCLTCAELPFLPELWMGLVVYLLLLLLAWWGQDRWQLPLWASNVLGVVIAIGTVCWLSVRLSNLTAAWAIDVPLSAVMVPYLGPVTMAL